MSQLKHYLESLDLTEDFLITCNYSQAKAHLDNAYKTSNKTHHKTIAYQKLNDIFSQLYYPEPEKINPLQQIPLTYFSFSHQQAILIKYEEMIKNINPLHLNTIPELEQSKNQLFLKIGQSLHNQKEQRKALIKKSINDYEQQSLKQWIIHQYRCLMIRLFAKENLSDFEYLKALQSGELKPIFEPYKFLWPLKWLAALINCLLLPLQYLKDVPRRYNKFLINKLKYYQKLENPSLKDSFYKTLYKFIIFLSYTTSFWIMLFPDLPIIFYIAPLVVYSDVLEIFANPINQFLKPFSQKLHISPTILGVISLIGLIILFNSMPLFEATEILARLYLALAIFQNINKVSQFDLQLVYKLSIIILHAEIFLLFDSIFTPYSLIFLAIIWHFYEFSYQLLTHIFELENNSYNNQLKCLLPLTEHLEPPQAIQVSVNLHCKSQRLSHLFFNTQAPQEVYLDENYYQKQKS